MLERKDVKMSGQCRLPADGGRTRYAALGSTEFGCLLEIKPRSQYLLIHKNNKI